MTLNLSYCKYTVTYLRKHYFSKHGGAQSSFLESIIRKSNTGCKYQKVLISKWPWLDLYLTLIHKIYFDDEIFVEKQEFHFVENVESLSSKYHFRFNLQQFRSSSDPILTVWLLWLKISWFSVPIRDPRTRTSCWIWLEGTI